RGRRHHPSHHGAELRPGAPRHADDGVRTWLRGHRAIEAPQERRGDALSAHAALAARQAGRRGRHARRFAGAAARQPAFRLSVASVFSSTSPNASTSASPDAQPRLIRIAPAASAGATPIAANTFDGPTLPDEQAEPEEAAIPSRSSRISSVAAASPGMAKASVLGSRAAAAPNTTASGANANRRAAQAS